MKKDINVYMFHSKVNSATEFVAFLKIDELESYYNFIWNSKDPGYLFASDEIYTCKKNWRRFQKLYNKASIKIIYAAEAFSPDWNLFDYAIGFDAHLSNEDRFCILPPFTLFYKEFYEGEFRNKINSVNEAYGILREKKKFCNFLYSNYNAHPNRDKLFYLISNYKKVDSLGKHLNNVGNRATGYIGHRLECIPMKSSYKFSIAAENANYKGYTSEKILTSLCAHTVPVYWGNPDIILELNPKSFINCHQFESQQEILNRIKEIDINDDLWCEIISEPWQTEEQVERSKQRMTNYVCFIDSIFAQEISAAKRVPEGAFVYRYREILFSSKIPRLNLCKIVWKKIMRTFKTV
ncbi:MULTISPECIES: glycosyltransferase family 10 [Bacteroides]|uniref:glycosyltransferase family 10 domain-containing protein n=1 Tax=Bacteroides TaxID=816 RepID=UPI00259C7716|nr:MULTISPECIES: glycosyltransferase family 10 [Bacteroides]